MNIKPIGLATALLMLSFGLKAQEKNNIMKNETRGVSVNCKLTTPELQQRKKTIIAELKNLILETIETDAGFRYKFDGSDKVLDLLLNFIKTERLCCDFFDFQITVAGEDNFTWLELSGQAGTKEFIKNEIEF